MTGPWSSWLPGPDLCGAASYWLVGWVLGWLAEEPQEAPGPVCPTGGWKLVLKLVAVGPDLVLACWWVGGLISWHGWLRALGCHKAGAGLQMSGLDPRQLVEGSKVSWNWHCPPGGQSWGPGASGAHGAWCVRLVLWWWTEACGCWLQGAWA